MNTFAEKVHKVTNDLAELLISKNEKYGNSALEPVRVFSKASATEQLLVRLDDKLSRLRTQSITEDEDVLQDLLGYLVLLKISMQQTPANDIVEPTESLLGKKFILNPYWHEIIPLKEIDKICNSKAFNNPEELEFSQTDSDGNVTLKNHDITIPFIALKET